jgi:hypothetical protein
MAQTLDSLVEEWLRLDQVNKLKRIFQVYLFNKLICLRMKKHEMRLSNLEMQTTLLNSKRDLEIV